MNIKDYFEIEFKSDLRQLQLHKPNSIVLAHTDSFGIDGVTQFFGGQEWRYCQQDLQGIVNKNYFVLSLFAMVCNDLNMHSNFPEHYFKFRGLTNYPKFGWSGFGPHFESPAWIINQPLKLGLVNFDDKLLSEFVTFWKLTADDFLAKCIPDINYSNFFHDLCEDRCFSTSETLMFIKDYILKN